jgi:hypothetical protein
MAEVSYNGVDLSYCRTKEWRQEPVYSGAEGTGDYLYTKYTVTVESVFNAETQPGLDFVALSGTAVDVMTAVKTLLETPRQAFSYAINGEVLLKSPPAGALTNPQAGRATDANNGPVTSVRITSFTEHTFIVSLTVTTWLCDCSGGGALISNRWSSDFDIDLHQYVTITTHGLAIVRADMNQNPDSLRGIIVPKIFNGFVRRSSHYGVQENGLALEYTYTDQEVFRVPPTPAYEADGEYLLSSPEGAVLFAEGRLRLVGYKYTNPKVLAGLAILLVLRKLIGKAALNKDITDRVTGETIPGWQLRGFGLRQSYSENEVECNMKVLVANPPYQVKDPNGNRITIGTDGIVYSTERNWYARNQNLNMSQIGNQQPPPPAVYGSANLMANLAYLRDPCTTKNARPPASEYIANPRFGPNAST